MNHYLSLPSPPLWAGERVAEGRERGIRTGSSSQCTAAKSWGLSMNRRNPDPSQEGSKHSFASCQFPSWEGLGVGSWSQCIRKNRKKALHEPRKPRKLLG